MKYLLSILLICSITLTQELTVEGDLTVTGNIQNQTIDSLAQVIANQQQQINSLLSLLSQLQTQIALLESQMIFLGQDLNNADCFGIVGGGAVLDECGVCDNDSSNDCVQDCFGEWGGTAEYDACGECGGVITDEVDCPNYALSFDGVSDYVEVQNNNGSLSIPGEMTIQAQVTVNGFSDGFEVWILCREINGGNQNQMNYDLSIGISGNFVFHIENSVNDNDYFVTSSTIATIGETYYVAGIYDGGSLKIIVNSTVENTIYVEDGFTAYTGVSDSLFIGRLRSNDEGSNNYFNGILDEIRIWNRTLQLEEIISNQNSTLTGNESGLVGYWNFNEGSGSTLNDLSINENHGTLMNMNESNWVER